jgi:hypothetical protein
MMTLTLIIENKNYSSWSLRAWIFMKTDMKKRLFKIAKSMTKVDK